jgi:hypothetical protein
MSKGSQTAAKTCKTVKQHKGTYTLVTFGRTVTPYRDSVDGTRDHVTYKTLVNSNVMGMFGALSVFDRRIKRMIRLRPKHVQRDTSPPSAPLAFFTFMMLLALVTNWEPHGVTLAGYRYAMRHGMRVQIVTPYRVSNLQRYGVTVRGDVTSVCPPKKCPFHAHCSI